MGIIHRDLKPGNLLMGAVSTPQVLIYPLPSHALHCLDLTTNARARIKYIFNRIISPLLKAHVRCLELTCITSMSRLFAVQNPKHTHGPQLVVKVADPKP
jgi:serine/threonine protein kinase